MAFCGKQVNGVNQVWQILHFQIASSSAKMEGFGDKNKKMSFFLWGLSGRVRVDKLIFWGRVGVGVKKILVGVRV